MNQLFTFLNNRRCLTIALLVFLSACENVPSQNTQEAPVATATQPESVEHLAEAFEPVAAIDEPAWQYDLNQLLADADEALLADRLTTPIEDNAFDRYHAVLLLQPGNEDATKGLNEIFNRYTLLAREAIKFGQFGKARALIERARSVQKDSTLLVVLSDELAERQRQRARVEPQIEIEPDQKEIELSVDGLNRRDDVMVEQLQTLAMKVREADETLLIVARSDTEGRWIYQRMAEGVPGYRLRGDIRLGRTPKVLLLPPIE